MGTRQCLLVDMTGHSPLFWVGLFLCIGAITIYVLSEDLSWRLF
jgi:hypothetical protein